MSERVADNSSSFFEWIRVGTHTAIRVHAPSGKYVCDGAKYIYTFPERASKSTAIFIVVEIGDAAATEVRNSQHLNLVPTQGGVGIQVFRGPEIGDLLRTALRSLRGSVKIKPIGTWKAANVGSLSNYTATGPTKAI